MYYICVYIYVYREREGGREGGRERELCLSLYRDAERERECYGKHLNIVLVYEDD
jgi:hypothetical protein